MTMEIDEAPCTSSRTTAAEEQRSRSPETTPTGGKEKHSADVKSPSTVVSPLQAPESVAPTPHETQSFKRTTSAASVLGKRNASAMEQTEPPTGENATFSQSPFGSGNHAGKYRHHALDQVVSSAFRRESMISPMDPVAQSSGPTAGMEATSSSRDASLGLLRKLSSVNVQEDETSASLPGFKSLFGALESGTLRVL